MTKQRFFVTLFMTVSLLFTVQGAHRPVFLVKEKVAKAAKRAETDSAYAKGKADIVALADALLQKNDITKVDYLGMAYLLTGESKYADKAKDVLMKGAQSKTWSDKEMMMRNPPWQSDLNTAHRLFAVSNAYDAIYETLTPAERKHLAGEYYRLAIKPLAEDWVLPETRIHTLNSMGHNWWSSCVGICGVGTLAFRDELPSSVTGPVLKGVEESLKGYFAFGGDDFQKKPRTYDRNGGMYEGINYGMYGTQEALLYALALKNVTGRTMEGLDNARAMAVFFPHASYPRSGDMMTVYFGDSHKHTSGHNPLMLLDALGYGTRASDWYLARLNDGQHKEYMGLSTPVGFVCEPEHKSVKEPGLPLSSLHPDMGWATMRDSWADDATMLAVKSGLTWNHAHADAGSFILFHNGADILGEAGRCWYKLPEYRNYFFTSKAHNVVTLDGEGQPRFQQYHGSSLPGHVSNLTDTLGVRYVLADATGPNSDRFNRYLRSFLWIDDVLLIVDDLANHDEGKYDWIWHPIGDVKKRGIDLDIRNGNAHVLLRQLYPETLAPSDFVHDYPNLMTWDVVEATGEDNKGSQPYYVFHLPKKHDRVKGVTAVMLDGDNAPEIEKRSGDNWIGVRIRKGGRVTDVYVNQLADGRLMHQNSWISPDGWQTDAYLTVLTYDNETALKQGKPSRKGIVYGSRLKDPSGALLFSDMEKRNRVW